MFLHVCVWQQFMAVSPHCRWQQLSNINFQPILMWIFYEISALTFAEVLSMFINKNSLVIQNA
jgi:hypothetical protein